MLAILLGTALSLTFCAAALAEDAPSPDAPQAQTATSPTADATDDKWHVQAIPYLWFPGVHGTAGNNGHNISVHASAGDLLSNFNIGLMGAGLARKGPWFGGVDFMWIRLSDTKTLPLNEITGRTAKFGATQFYIAPEVGGRLLDVEHMKFDLYTGLRIWHLGQSLTLNPSILGFSGSAGQSWVDPLFGARMQFPLGQAKKVVATVQSDIALFGVGSQTSYQFIGDLGYNLNPKWDLRAGYRFLKVNYLQNQFVFDVIMNGAIIGATYTFK
jgi:hypothetical protein